ncbi:esterase/lipase family protein [Ramlibacter rhizophilus]|uniref:Alpha/beta fold hydrolase n=1 Tax=Ramlibacter rhizophilus TaxID=1781167 RepID=A0A4Z0BMI5_9BURK|nr:alpha/beta fold hydrolase [Ramlibacter rhizophilus]TFY99467.1 alpha/beta fold hydrolase [Ramlibacter rhizophilus]
MPTVSTTARLLQGVVLAALATAAAWAIWTWPRSPFLALLGALFILLGHSIFIACELLVLQPRIADTDDAPPAALRERLRAWAVESLIGLKVFGWWQPFRWRAVPDRLHGPRIRGRPGVVLVHGFGCNRGFWLPWLRRLDADGRAFIAVNLEPTFEAIDAYAPIVEDAVRKLRHATGHEPLLVGHSMGGLALRAWLRTQPPGATPSIVTISTPHAGTWLAGFSRTANGRQMRLNSDWLRQLHADLRAEQARAFTCWWSHCDNVVMPASAARLAGADNRLVRGPAHVELAFHDEVMAQTLAVLDTRPT